MGIGKLGLISNIKTAIKFFIIFSGAYRIIESILKNDYTLADFIGNLTMDMAKIAVGAAASVVVGSLLTSTAFVSAGIIVVAVGLFLVGWGVTKLLDDFDKKHGISERLIDELKKF